MLELSYDDGKYETGVSNGGIKKYGFGVRFEPGSQPFKINEIRILSWIKGTPKDSDNFTVRITDKDLLPLWEKSLPFALFTSNPTWLEIKVPDITIVDTFYVQLYAPTLGQGLGPYIGTDRSTLNEHSEMLSGWEITEWALSIPKEQTNWMIRVKGNNAVKSE